LLALTEMTMLEGEKRIRNERSTAAPAVVRSLAAEM
jgi:hypothetical protein